jgi:integrase
MKSGNASPWVKSAVPNLYRRSDSGRYYARIYRDGKSTWKSLKTNTFSVAKEKLRKELAALPSRQRFASEADPTLSDLAALRREEIANSAKLKRRTKDYYRECLDVIEKTFPDFDRDPAQQVTAPACQAWAVQRAEEYSPTRFNNMVGELRHLFRIGIREEWLDRNPADSIEKRSPKPKELRLPSQEEFRLLVQEMQQAGGRLSIAFSEFVELLAYSGCRIGEARNVKWEDCDFEKGVLVVRGDPDEATKNSEIRRVPINPSLRGLLERMRKPDTQPEDAVTKVVRCQRAIDRACERLGIERVTHHDFRHLFATRCIESGVDVPTVARWLGHKDGGALAMKTYGHLRDEHSRMQAEKVSF